MRAVIDTNVWVSALLNPSGHPAQLLDAFRENRFTLVISRPLLEELARVMTRPRLIKRYHIRFEQVQELTYLLAERSILVELTGWVKLCRDLHDNMVLETAIRGQAQFLVSRDDDLKRDPELIEQMQRHGVQIVSVQQFLDILSLSSSLE